VPARALESGSLWRILNFKTILFKVLLFINNWPSY
jgi:hypothetical protein